MFRSRGNTDLIAIIRKDLLEGLLASARRKYPFEFFALLGGRKENNIVYLEEFYYIPWKEGYTHAIIDINHVPLHIMGSFHSHPTSSFPSPQDKTVFPFLGYVHLIAFPPFSLENVAAFNTEGKRIRLRVREPGT